MKESRTRGSMSIYLYIFSYSFLLLLTRKKIKDSGRSPSSSSFFSTRAPSLRCSQDGVGSIRVIIIPDPRAFASFFFLFSHLFCCYSDSRGHILLIVYVGSFFLLFVSIVLDRGTCLTYLACNIIATRAALLIYYLIVFSLFLYL